ncbi:hypothetical protein [Bacillus gaemokensis]|uniref:hypothetical protein n=1 Tax=Bacillus gaemokensis TaxID=574375 RepID=UPI000ABABD72|nr:hypothetical protein [Bacillus gaemokensis]
MTEDEAWVRRTEINKRFKRYGVSFQPRKQIDKLVEKLHKEEVLVKRKRLAK